MTPTESAQSRFNAALGGLVQASGRGNDSRELLPPLVNLIHGLDHMAVALRATYLKLEEIERQLKRQQHGRP